MLGVFGRGVVGMAGDVSGSTMLRGSGGDPLVNTMGSIATFGGARRTWSKSRLYMLDLGHPTRLRRELWGYRARSCESRKQAKE